MTAWSFLDACPPEHQHYLFSVFRILHFPFLLAFLLLHCRQWATNGNQKIWFQLFQANTTKKLKWNLNQPFFFYCGQSGKGLAYQSNFIGWSVLTAHCGQQGWRVNLLSVGYVYCDLCLCLGRPKPQKKNKRSPPPPKERCPSFKTALKHSW